MKFFSKSRKLLRVRKSNWEEYYDKYYEDWLFKLLNQFTFGSDPELGYTCICPRCGRYWGVCTCDLNSS